MNRLKNSLAIWLALVLVLVAFPTPVVAQSTEIFFWPADSGPAGTPVGVAGYGFTADSVITITWDGDPIDTEPEVVVTDPGGWFGAMIVVPDVPEGDYTVRATDGEGLSAEALFCVGPPPAPEIWLFLADSDPVGTWVGIMGYGFTPDSVITITWNGEPINTEPEVVVTTHGFFGATTVVPDVPDGCYTIAATDEDGLSAEALFCVSPPIPPPPSEIHIWLSPEYGPVGTPVRIHGYGFTPDSVITITWADGQIATDPEVVMADPRGGFWTSILVPDVPEGDYTVRATDGEGLSAEAPFWVGFPPAQTWLWPTYTGPAGTAVMMNGQYFTPGSAIAITWGGEPIDTDPEETVTDSWGYFNTTIVVPDAPEGYYTIAATDGEGLSAEALFYIGPAPPPQIWLWPPDGPAGCWVEIGGYMFTPNSELTITWADGPVTTEPEVVVTDRWGTFRADVLVPDVEDGCYTIRVADAEGLWAEASLSVVPAPPSEIWLWPSEGLVDTLVVIGGYGFAQHSAVTITWEGTSLDTYPEMVVIDRWGYFWAEIVIPDVPAGYYTIVATDEEGLSAETTFTVIELPLMPPQAIENVICHIEELELGRGIENSLVRTLEAAISSLDRGQTNAAANQLGAFINQVNALKGKRLPDAEASALVEKIQAIIDSL